VAISSLQKRPRGTTHERDPFLSNAKRFFLEHATSLPSCIIRGGKSVCFTGALSAVTNKKRKIYAVLFLCDMQRRIHNFN
jgi:hypothetical protein